MRGVLIGGAILAAVLGWRFRGPLACRLGWRHVPERVFTVTGWAYRCKRCGQTAPTVLELLDPKGEDGRVDPERLDHRARLHGFVFEDEVPRGRFMRGRTWRRQS